MANCGQEVRRVPSSRAKVGKSLGSRRLPVVWWGDRTGDDEWTAADVGAVDEDGEMGPPPLPDAVGTVIDRVDDSLSEAVRPPTAFLGDGGCDCDETALSDLDRSWRRWADERWTVLGDLLPASRLMVGTGIFIVNGGGWGGGRIGLSPDDPAFSSLSLENRRGEMFKLATELDTYCCRVLKKLIFVTTFSLSKIVFVSTTTTKSFSFLPSESNRVWWKARAPHCNKDVNGLVDRIHLPLLFPTYKGGWRGGVAQKEWAGEIQRDAGFSVHACVFRETTPQGYSRRLYKSRRTRRDA